MSGTGLRADCARCKGLCCVSLVLERSDRFALDKPAGVPCPHLQRDHACSIHHELEARGLAGCRAYDCGGAGPRVIEELFQGRSFQDEPELLPPMMEAFWIMRQLHESLLLLEQARALPLDPAREQTRVRLARAGQPAGGWSRETLAEFDVSAFTREVHTFLASLAPLLRARPRRRLAVIHGE